MDENLSEDKNQIFEKSESVAKLFGALAKAQKEFKTPVKDQTVKFEFGGRKTEYKFANLASIIETNRESMTKNGLSISQVKTMRGEKFFLVTILAHESGEYISSLCPLPNPTSKKPQDYGAFLTYMRRYSYASIQGVESDQDDDAQTLNPESNTNSNSGQQKRAARETSSQTDTQTRPAIKNHAPGQNQNSITHEAIFKLAESKGWTKKDIQDVSKAMFEKGFMLLEESELKILELGVKKKTKEDLLG